MFTKQEEGLEEEDCNIELPNLMNIFNKLTYEDKVRTLNSREPSREPHVLHCTDTKQ